MDSATLYDQFEARTIDAVTFRHERHIAVAWEMLRRHDFLTAITRYATGIREIAEAAGASDKFNLTITLAFLSLIAERMTDEDSYAEFMAGNPHLMSSSVLQQMYSDDRLTSGKARTGFLMPDRVSA